MTQTNWYQMDNVAKVFLATCGNRDTRTLRVSCTLTTEIIPDMLQEALLQTIHIRPQFQVRIRRGVFWHYMEETHITPVVKEETGRVCPSLYAPGRSKSLHYQVSYYGCRINLDLFHALSDGTGALEFLNLLVANYLNLIHDNTFSALVTSSGASADDLTEDSFKQFYKKEGKTQNTLKKAYHPSGLRLPYNQLQFFEIQMPVEQILPKAKACGVSLTSYLGALFMLAIKEDMPALSRKQPITVSMPVNLRNYYPSNTARNFFNNVNVTHVFDEEITESELAKEFDQKLKSNLTPEKIMAQMDAYEHMESVMAIKAVPLVLKQPVVRYFSRAQDKKVSLVLSNLGVQKPAEAFRPYIANYSAFCSSSNLFVTVSSYQDTLTLGVTSPYANTGVLKDFIRHLSSQGIAMKVYATEVIR